VRFFGGGLLALGVAGAAHQLLAITPFPDGHAAVLGLGALLLLVSALSFVSAGEPKAPASLQPSGFGRFLKEGLEVYRTDGRFRLFVYARWLEGAAAMALPFYVVQAAASGVGIAEVAMLLGAQTAGALVSNPLWGWWGDRIGKRPLLEGVAVLSIMAPGLALAWPAADGTTPALAWFGVVFFVLGAVGNGGTIAQLGYLMEISPDDRRPVYSGYFNAIVAPAALSPLAGAAFVESIGLPLVFAASAVAALLQFLTVRRLRRLESKEAEA
jgi:predicted MFS family arabinose efflux permease